MAISIGGFTFTGKSRTFEEGPVDQPLQIMGAPGAYGSSLLVSPIRGRELRIDYWLDGIPSVAALTAILRQYDYRSGILTGTLIKDGPAAASYGNCVFLRFVAEGRPYYSAGGVVGWVQRGQLYFYQTRL